MASTLGLEKSLNETVSFIHDIVFNRNPHVLKPETFCRDGMAANVSKDKYDGLITSGTVVSVAKTRRVKCINTGKHFVLIYV